MRQRQNDFELSGSDARIPETGTPLTSSSLPRKAFFLSLALQFGLRQRGT